MEGKGRPFISASGLRHSQHKRRLQSCIGNFFSFDLIYFVDILGWGVPGAGEQLVGFMSLLPSYGS